MTRESTEALLQANGKTLSDCAGECEVDIARKLGADYVLSGRVTQFGTRLSVVTMRLFSTVDGRLIGSAEARATNLDQLQDAMDGALDKLLSFWTKPKDAALSNVQNAFSRTDSMTPQRSATTGDVGDPDFVIWSQAATYSRRHYDELLGEGGFKIDTSMGTFQNNFLTRESARPAHRGRVRHRTRR